MKATITIEVHAAPAAPTAAPALLPKVDLGPLVRALFTLAGISDDGDKRIRPYSHDPRTVAGEAVLESLASFLSCVDEDVGHGDPAKIGLALTGSLSGLVGCACADIESHMGLLGKNLPAVREAFQTYREAFDAAVSS